MYSLGSLWRRWDLHIHTPGTALADQYSDWEQFLKAIEGQNEVVALGVTDYLSITNYCRMRAYKGAGRLSNILFLLPNIEFRILPQTAKGHAVNIHLLIDPSDLSHESKINDALSRLNWTYSGQIYCCSPEKLQALGRAHNPEIIADTAALRHGVQEFKIEFSTFKGWYENETWLKRNSLVAVAAGEDGLSGLSKNSGWSATREEICRFAQLIFSGSPSDRNFWLGKKNSDGPKILLKLGGHKPCIHGSDAHSIEKLFRPDQQRFCWIKADPNFEGLRQIVFEPETRVYIGATTPEFHDESRVISRIEINSNCGWFKNESVEFNPGLVSIIGQKGSGKSALADLIAYAAGSWRDSDRTGFLTRARDYQDGTNVRLVWADGHVTAATLFDEPEEQEQVRYLSQRFVEKLCSEDYEGTELVDEIESVIFAHLDPTDTLNASNFSELRAIKTEQTRAQMQQLRARIQESIREDHRLRENQKSLPEKKLRVAALQKEREALEKQLPKAQSEAEKQIQMELATRREQLAKLQRTIAIHKQTLVKLENVRARIRTFRQQGDRFTSELIAMLPELGIEAQNAPAFNILFQGDVDGLTAARAEEIRDQIEALEGNENNAAPGTLRRLMGELAIIEARITQDQARKEKIEAIQKRLTAIATESGRIEHEIANIEGPEKLRLDRIRAERLETYLAYFLSLKEEQKILEELYEPVQQQLGLAGEEEKSLEFSIRWNVDLDGWLERAMSMFDQRKMHTLGGIEGLASNVSKALVPGWQSGDLDKIREGLVALLDRLRTTKAHLALKNSVTVSHLLDWAFDVEHITLRYGLRYYGTELEKLSPGTKGIVLLILYLGMDSDDTRPLVIDQPEENLDSESIFKLLSRYFRLAKARRQVILITHNPNLVVNTDSEQVIVAEAQRQSGGFPLIGYVSGALENSFPDQPGIRQHVCRILEGGEQAFSQREKRYGIQQ